MARILVVDDDLLLQNSLELFFTHIGHEVFKASDGSQAIELTKAINPDMIILDIMMPKIDGFEVCKIVKQERNTPIIFLSARDEEEDRIKGFEYGADDYIAKPFSLKELALRINARLRNNIECSNNRLEYDNLVIDNNQKQFFIDYRLLDLSPVEFELIWVLASNPNKLFKHEELIQKVWNFSKEINPNLLHVYIRKLRHKIEVNPKRPKYLHNIWGQGYVFRI